MFLESVERIWEIIRDIRKTEVKDNLIYNTVEKVKNEIVNAKVNETEV